MFFTRGLKCRGILTDPPIFFFLVMNRRYVFTLNNYTPAEENAIKANASKCRYIVIGREQAPTSGTPHLHVFIVYHKNTRVAAARAMWPTRAADFSFARESSMTCANYCKKHGDYWESGELPLEPGQAEAKRWEEALINARAGKFEEIPPDIYIRYVLNLKRIWADYQPIPQPIDTLDFHWYWGPTGTGKSVTARGNNPDYYLKGINKWWDGYRNQTCVIIEEWSPMNPELERAMGHLLKQWADHHPFPAEKKGSMAMIRPQKIIITSNYSMEECFRDPNNLLPLKRRFQELHFSRWPNSPQSRMTQQDTPQTPPNQWQLFPSSPTQQQP